MPIPDSLQENELAVALAEIVIAAKLDRDQLIVEIAPDQVLAALRKLKNELGFEQLSTVTGVDRFPSEPRFEVVYHLQSVSNYRRLRLKVRLPGTSPQLESATQIYRSANWYERETYDLFGITFLNHPNLTRIMLPEDWVGHPLRKDYPVTGTRY